MAADPTSAPQAICPTCGAALSHGEMCPRCLFGDVLAVLDGPVPPRKASAPEAGSTGRKIGEYDLIEELGRGGMGVVWKARHRRLNRIVALKLVRGGCLPGESVAKRFRREAEAVAQLKHPNIVSIHEVGEYDDQLFLSMDWVPGGSLADWLKRVAFSPKEAATLVAKVARGVHHAHEHHVLHRDLKPGNILLDHAGEPKVCDFGLARIGEMDSSLTMSGELIGTPAYLSPEQASGKMKDLGPASDTYSLGAILYELLCGRPPFSADSLPALLRKVSEDDPMRPISHYSGGRIPLDLSTISLKCLQKQPSSRYGSALDLAEDLERWLRGEPIQARPIARVERIWKWVCRKPVVAGLWFGITVLTIVAAAIALLASIRLSKQQKEVQKLAEASRHQVARQLSESAQRYANDGDYFRALPALAEAIGIGTADPRLDEADRIRFNVLLRCSPKLRQAWFTGINITRAEGTLDGGRLMVATDNTVEVWSVYSSKRIGVPLKLDTKISNLQFDSLAGRWVLIEVEGKLMLWEADSGAKRNLGLGRIYTPPDAYMQRGSTFISYDGVVASLRSLATGEKFGRPMEHKDRVAWSLCIQDLNRVVSADSSNAIYFWDASTGLQIGSELQLPNREGRTIVTFDAYDPRSKQIALHRDRDCWIVDCASGKIVKQALNVSDSPQSLGWDDEGTPLFLGRSNEGLNLRYFNDTIRWILPHRGLGFRGSFSPGSGLVATQSWNGSARIWRASSGGSVSPYIWQNATPGSCILDPTGRWLFTRGDEPAGRLWELAAEEDGLPDISDQPVDYWSATNRLFIADQSGVVSAWKLDIPRQKIGEVRHPESSLVHAVPAEQAPRFLTFGKKTAIVWNAETFMPVGPAFTAENRIVHAAVDPSGTRMAIVLTDGQVEVHEVETGKTALSFNPSARQVSFSSDGSMLLVTSENSAQTFDSVTGQSISAQVDQSGGAPRAKFSPDGRHVAQWSGKQSAGQARVQVWMAATGKVEHLLPPHWQGITDVAWSPDSARLATAGIDQTLQLNEIAHGENCVPPIKHLQKVLAVGFSKDGRLFWSLAEKEITVWSAVSGEPVTPSLRQKSPVGAVFCGELDRQLAIVNQRYAPRIFSLEPDLRSPDELRVIAQALSGQTIVKGTSALRPLDLREMRDAWEKARKALNAW